MVDVHGFLRKYDLRHTMSRAEILRLMLARGAAMSEPDIEKEINGRCDRVTIYRTLSTFLDKGILHKVLDDGGVVKYAICSPACEHVSYHQHNHVHFKCNECGNTTCLDGVEVPAIDLPQNYQLTEANVLLQGVCGDCKE